MNDDREYLLIDNFRNKIVSNKAFSKSYYNFNVYNQKITPDKLNFKLVKYFCRRYSILKASLIDLNIFKPLLTPGTNLTRKINLKSQDLFIY